MDNDPLGFLPGSWSSENRAIAQQGGHYPGSIPGTPEGPLGTPGATLVAEETHPVGPEHEG